MTVMFLFLILTVLGCVISSTLLYTHRSVSTIDKNIDITSRNRLQVFSYDRLTLLILLIQFSFILVYFSNELARFPDYLANAYWIISSISGILVGYIGIKQSGKFVVLNFACMVIGILLLLFLLISLGVTSM